MENVGQCASGRPPVFQIGLALAGAISAGAYTAGVLDFLLQALSEWEKERDKSGIASHRVVLKVIAGASAGAITGALGAIALARGIHAIKFNATQTANCYPDSDGDHQKLLCVLQPLYETWVRLPSMVAADGVGGFLGTEDTKIDTSATKPIVRSLLDSSLLDRIKQAALTPRKNQPDPLIAAPLPFISKHLHVYITISNMRGIPFNVEFGRNTYGMQTIGDRIHYVLTDLGDADLGAENTWLENNSRNASHSISVKTLPTSVDDDPGDWELYATSAIASGAFPVGLASRRLRFPWKHYYSRQYPIPIPPQVSIKPSFPPGIEEQYEKFCFESVDGGLANNDPFDYAQYAMTGAPAVPVDGKAVEKAIIMVAPFPEPPTFLPENSPSPAAAAIMRAIFPSLVNQARFRTSELAPAADERDFSRFLIAPVRRIPRTKPPTRPEKQAKPERYAIACGLLGGFGGFLDEEFRAHDFQLGRRNCQQFLRASFLVPPKNVILDRADTTDMQPVIPLVGSATEAVPLPRWPQMTEKFSSSLCRNEAKNRRNCSALN